VDYDARRRMGGLKDGRLDGVRIGIPIVSLSILNAAENYAFAIRFTPYHPCRKRAWKLL